MRHQILLLLFLAFLATAVIAPFAAAGHYDVYILTGQSNSIGTTGLESPYDPGTHPADDETAFFWSNVDGASSSDPDNIILYGDSGDAVTTLQMQQGNGGNPAFWGPEFGFARTLYDAGERDVMIVKLSRGGGGNNYWLPNTGHMYNHIMEQLDIALGAVQAAGDTFDVQGLLYLQGESNDATGAANADTRLRTLIDDVAAHINANFDGAAQGMKTVIGEIAASQSTSNRQLTTTKQRALAGSDPNIFFAPTADLPLKSDNIHFGRDSKLEIGARFARAVLGEAIIQVDPIIASYSADAGTGGIPSPTSQEWTEIGAGVGVALEGVVIDDTNAWRISDDSTASNPGYRQAISPEELQEMYEEGWAWTLKFKVIHGAGLAFWSFDGAFDPGWGIGSGSMNGFLLTRLADDSLNVAVWPTGQIVNLGPGSADEFHEISMVGEPGSAAFEFSIDGQFGGFGTLTTDYMLTGYNNMASFLSGSTWGTGREVLWNTFELSVVPEPGSLVLLLTGGVLFGWRRRGNTMWKA